MHAADKENAIGQFGEFFFPLRRDTVSRYAGSRRKASAFLLSLIEVCFQSEIDEVQSLRKMFLRRRSLSAWPVSSSVHEFEKFGAIVFILGQVVFLRVEFRGKRFTELHRQIGMAANPSLTFSSE